jgi:hypothetical protein
MFLHVHTMTLRLKAGTAEPDERSIARQRLGKHVPMATDTNAAIGELWETTFSVRFVPKLCNHDCDRPTSSRAFVVLPGL